MQQKLEKQAPRLARFLKEIEIQFKWLFIWIFLVLFRRRSRRHNQPLDPHRVRKVLFLRHDKIGDMVVTLSTFHTLISHLPHVKIGVLASTSNRVVVQHDPAVYRTHIYDKQAKGILGTIKELSAEKYDVVIDLLTGPSVTSLIIAMATAPGAYRIGVGKEGTYRFYDYYTLEDINHAVGLHISEVFRSSLMPLGINLEQGVTDGKIRLSEAEEARGMELGAEIRQSGYRRHVFMNFSAGKLDRMLAEEKCVEYTHQISHAFPEIQFVLSFAPTDFKMVQRAREAGGDNVRLIPNGLSILDIIALLPHFDGVISVDTSICHIAAKLDVPLLALYNGNEVNFSRWYPYGRRVWVVRSPDHRHVDGITLPQFIAATEKFFVDAFNVTPKQVAS
jgi:ADP-heptose:LPS heptosyltransferase